MGRINTNRFIKACKDSGGIISLIAKRLSCDRSTIYYYLEREPQMRKYIEDAKDAAFDIAESKILNSIALAQPKCDMEDVKWYLARFSKRTSPETSINTKIVNNIEPTYKFIIEKPDDIRDKMEAEPETNTGV